MNSVAVVANCADERVRRKRSQQQADAGEIRGSPSSRRGLFRTMPPPVTSPAAQRRAPSCRILGLPAAAVSAIRTPKHGGGGLERNASEQKKRNRASLVAAGRVSWDAAGVTSWRAEMALASRNSRGRNTLSRAHPADSAPAPPAAASHSCC
ncbi:hypothetical protein MRX96_008237 [Rhipicephalus microplus]